MRREDPGSLSKHVVGVGENELKESGVQSRSGGERLSLQHPSCMFPASMITDEHVGGRDGLGVRCCNERYDERPSSVTPPEGPFVVTQFSPLPLLGVAGSRSWALARGQCVARNQIRSDAMLAGREGSAQIEEHGRMRASRGNRKPQRSGTGRYP